MKKTLKVLGLLVVAAALFAGCKNNADDEQKNIQDALFDPTELTVDTRTLEFSDGNWVFRFIEEEDDVLNSKQMEFKVSNNQIVTTESITYITYECMPIPEGTPEEMKEAAKELGYKIDGNTATLYKEYDYVELVRKSQTDADFQAKVRAYENDEMEIPDPEVEAYYYGTMFMVELSFGSMPAGTKTNSDKTKYYCLRTNSHDNSTSKIYIAKQ
jgi:hypothetical protein